MVIVPTVNDKVFTDNLFPTLLIKDGQKKGMNTVLTDAARGIK